MPVEDAPRSRREARERAAQQARRGRRRRGASGAPQPARAARPLTEAPAAPRPRRADTAPLTPAPRSRRDDSTQVTPAPRPRFVADDTPLRVARAALAPPSPQLRREGPAAQTTPVPRSRREARALAEATPRSRREARALAERRRTTASPLRSLTHRVAAPVMVTALVAAGGVSALVGLPTKVAAGLPEHSLAATSSSHLSSPAASGTLVSGSIASGPVASSGGALTDLRQSSTSASRGSMHRLTLAWGTAAVVEGRRLMTARVQTMESSITAGVTATDEACAEARGLAHDLAFHEPILDGRKTSGFGWRWGRMHNGTDFGADVGTQLYAVGRGTVSAAGWNSGLGYHVKITLDSGELIVYGHMSRITATIGDRVVPGTTIGEVGSTGRSTGAHLHLEVRTDEGPMDPLPWLEARRA